MNATSKYSGRILIILSLLICIFLHVHAEDYGQATVERTKELGGAFNVKKGGKVDIQNMYGGITITHWDKKNEVDIKVIITAKAGSVQQAFAILERANVTFADKGADVTAKTTIKSQNNGRGESLDIHYYITAHPDIPMKLNQQYGNINMPDENNINMELIVKYGNIRGGDFSKKLDIDGKYSNISLGNVNQLDLDISYCGDVTVKDGEKIRIDCSYSNLNMGNIQQLNVSKKYGNLKAKVISDLKVDAKYSDLKVDKLIDKLNCSLSYSTLTVKEVSSSFNSIASSARYGNLNLSISEKADFIVEANNMKYGSFKMNGFNTSHMNVVAPTFYNYTVNKGGNAKITFDGNNYSNITIKKL